MNKFFTFIIYALTITFGALVLLILGVGFCLLLLFLQGLIGGTFLYYSYPFLQATLLPGLLANGSLSWLNSVLLIVAFKVIFGSKVALDKKVYEPLVKCAKRLLHLKPKDLSSQAKNGYHKSRHTKPYQKATKVVYGSNTKKQ